MFDLKTNKQDVMETFPKQKNYSLKYMKRALIRNICWELQAVGRMVLLWKV